MTLTSKEHRELATSIYSSILALEGKAPVGLARELSQDLNAQMPAGEPRDGFLVPLRVLCESRHRTLSSTGSFASAGALVGLEEGPIQHLLRPYSAVVAAGAQVLEGLRGTVGFGRESTGTTFAWYAEGDSISESTPVFKLLSLSPRRLAGACSITHQIDAGTDGILAGFLLESLARGLGAGIDTAALAGSGVLGEPCGIFNSTVPATVTFSGAATLAKAQSFIEQCAAANAADEAITFIARETVRTRWQAIQRWTSASVGLWTDDDKVLGKRAVVSTAVPTASICCGDWSQFVIGTWGPQGAVRILTDKFSLSLQGKVRFVAEVLADCGPLQPTFCVSTDSAVV